MLSQFDTVCLEDTFLQVADPEVDRNVQDVDEVGHIVQGEPRGHSLLTDLLERAPIDDGPEVVEERHTHNHWPVVAETARRVKHKRPVATSLVAGRRRRLPPLELLLYLFPSLLSSLFRYL